MDHKLWQIVKFIVLAIIFVFMLIAQGIWLLILPLVRRRYKDVEKTVITDWYARLVKNWTKT